MTTAQAIINKAFIIAGIKAANQVPEGGEANDALNSLNNILGVFQLEQLLQVSDKTYSGTLTPGLNPHTIGEVSATFNASRPNSILSAYIRDLNGYDYPLTLIDPMQYDEIVLKSLQTQVPAYLFYNPKFPNGELYLATVPNTAYTLHLRYKDPLSSFATLATSNSYAPGYDQLLIYQLAFQLATEYGYPMPLGIAQSLESIKNTIKKNNWQSWELPFDPRMPFGDQSGSGFNFHTGLSGW